MLSNTCIPLTIAPKLRICIVQSKQFLDRQGVSSREPLRMHYIQIPVSLTIGVQNAIESCRWSSIFYLPAVVSLVRISF